MGHGVDHKVEAHPVCLAGVLLWIARQIHPFPRVSKIGVVRNQNHEASSVVGNPKNHWFDFAPLFPGLPSVASVIHVWNLHYRIDVEEGVKDLVVQSQSYDSAIGKDPGHLGFDGSALLESPKIIHVQKAAAQQVLPQLLCLFARQVHAMWGNNVQVWIAKKFRIKSGDEVRAFVVDPNVAEPLDAPHEFTVGCGKIGAPSTAKARAALAGFEVCASKVHPRGASRYISVSVDETCEIELRYSAGFSLRQSGKHKKSGSENRTGYQTCALHNDAPHAT